MDYSKPEIRTLGDATRLIESINPLKPPLRPFDALGNPRTLPAYDLDE